MEVTIGAFGIDKLSVADRLSLIEQIWDTLLGEADSLELPLSHVEELDRRLAARASNPEAGSTWDEVKARLLSTDMSDR